MRREGGGEERGHTHTQRTCTAVTLVLAVAVVVVVRWRVVDAMVR